MTDYEALVKKDDVCTISGAAAMNYRLLKLEFKKSGGEPREWITFWSHFSTIDRDTHMPPETKLQYLFQATAENSEAREAVESVSPSAENYPKVIEYIKSRFGEYEMHVEINVRDALLQNVLQNVRAKEKTSVVKLYDRLETQLRALEILGVARDNFAAMLYPLVESALPEDTLRVWERSQYTASGKGVQDKLTQLMAFLKTEVMGERRVNMAKAAFKIDNNEDAKNDRSNRKPLPKINTESKTPTATDLVNTTQKFWLSGIMEIGCSRYRGDAEETKSRKDLIEASNTHVKEITTLAKSEDWNNIAGEHNPADLPSREVFPGTDNVRRLVEVTTKSGVKRRVVQRLFPLEVPSEDEEQGDGRHKPPAEDVIVREKTPNVEYVPVQEKITLENVWKADETGWSEIQEGKWVGEA
ncbi:hypothetical protein LAZ67_3002554 [Cordylochernes scorpioides]|uniref:Uncharacterized protein n=1 Tax=Cordylochernes scorpioides TaxID=51811 RepID=A0ABY6KB36_9ARAC|nr:hypothetical protein LAZ67_3002554 [Cordylochernes scorpioides]